MTQKSNGSGSIFVQEYLYVEEVPLDIIEVEYISFSHNKNAEAQRGVVVIDLLGDEE